MLLRRAPAGRLNAGSFKLRHCCGLRLKIRAGNSTLSWSSSWWPVQGAVFTAGGRPCQACADLREIAVDWAEGWGEKVYLPGWSAKILHLGNGLLTRTLLRTVQMA